MKNFSFARVNRCREASSLIAMVLAGSREINMEEMIFFSFFFPAMAAIDRDAPHKSAAD